MKKIKYELTFKNIKNINLRITKEGVVKVSAPKNVSEKFVEAFVESKRDYILKHVSRLENRSIVSVEDKSSIYLYGKLFRFEKIKDTKFSYSVSGDVVKLFYKNLERDYEKMLRELAYRRFNELSNIICSEMGLEYIEIKCKKFKGCYGKNYGKTKIALNYLLVHLDDKYIKHVIYHEYAHCIEMNHSSKFYAVLCKYDKEHVMNKKFINENMWKYC